DVDAVGVVAFRIEVLIAETDQVIANPHAQITAHQGIDTDAGAVAQFAHAFGAEHTRVQIEVETARNVPDQAAIHDPGICVDGHGVQVGALPLDAHAPGNDPVRCSLVVVVGGEQMHGAVCTTEPAPVFFPLVHEQHVVTV